MRDGVVSERSIAGPCREVAEVDFRLEVAPFFVIVKKVFWIFHRAFKSVNCFLLRCLICMIWGGCTDSLHTSQISVQDLRPYAGSRPSGHTHRPNVFSVLTMDSGGTRADTDRRHGRHCISRRHRQEPQSHASTHDDPDTGAGSVILPHPDARVLSHTGAWE